MTENDKVSLQDIDDLASSVPVIAEGKIILKSIPSSTKNSVYIQRLHSCFEHAQNNISVIDVSDLQSLASWTGRLDSIITAQVESRPGVLSYISSFYQRKFGLLSHVRKYQSKLDDLIQKAQELHEEKICLQVHKELKTRNLLFENEQEFQNWICSYSAFLTLIHCKYVFAVIMSDLFQGQMITYDVHTKQFLKTPFTIQVTDDKAYCKSVDRLGNEYSSKSLTGFIEHVLPLRSVPWNHIQDTYEMMARHFPDFKSCTFQYTLTRRKLESLLIKMASSTPHQPLYVVRPALSSCNNTCVLSYTTKRGRIRHVRIDIAHKLGCFTFKDPVSHSVCHIRRLQFKQWLENNGKALRVITRYKEVMAKDLLAGETNLHITHEMHTHIEELKSKLMQEGISVYDHDFAQAKVCLKEFCEKKPCDSAFIFRKSAEGEEFLALTIYSQGRYKNYLVSLVKIPSKLYIWGWNAPKGLEIQDVLLSLSSKYAQQYMPA